MNKKIEKILSNLFLAEKKIKIDYLFNETADDCYIIYSFENDRLVLSASDEAEVIAKSVRIDVYSKYNYTALIDEITKRMHNNNFCLIRNECSPDIFERDTKYYHKSLLFEIYEQKERRENG